MRRRIAILVAILFALFAVAGFFLAVEAMAAGEGHCPFMSGEQSICLMTALDHFSVWHGAMSVSLLSIILFTIALSCVRYPKGIDLAEFLPSSTAHQRWTGLPPPLHQTLLSCGILNPKIPS